MVLLTGARRVGEGVSVHRFFGTSGTVGSVDGDHGEDGRVKVTFWPEVMRPHGSAPT